MATRLGFESVVGPNQSANVPSGYGGLNWTGIGALDKGLLSTSPPTGYSNTIHGHVVAYGSPGAFADSDGTFSLRQGIFAAAWNTNERVTFTARLDGVVVGNLTVVMNQSAHTVHFGQEFRHIDEVSMVTHGGHDANPEDGGTGSQIGFDNLILAFDAAAAAPHEHHFHAADGFMPHIQDWPLA